MTIEIISPQDLDEHGELALDDVGEEPHDVGSESNSGKKNKKKRDGSTLRKAPQAPKRFKSSYICFFMAKQPEIKDELGDKATVTEISKRSAQMWRSLPPEERAHWDDVAAKDKQRYMVEKASYTGPWQVPWKRAKKDPSAPKRPMSAFLYFSQGKRRQIKDANPSLKNTEVSRLLGEMWRNAPEEERRPHIEKEKEEREKYKVAIADWRKDYEARMEKERKAQAEQAAYMANMYPNPNADPHPHQQPQQHPYAGDPSMMGQYPVQQPSHNMGPPPPPPGQGYGYGAPMYPYSYPVSPYQFPTNGKQPVILGPSGTPRYPPPGPPAANYSAAPHPGPPPGTNYSAAPPPGPAQPAATNYGSAPPPGPPHAYNSGHGQPPSYAAGSPPPQQPPPPPQQGYEMQPAPHQHQHQHQHHAHQAHQAHQAHPAHQAHHYDYQPPEHGGMDPNNPPPPPTQHHHHQHPHHQE